MWGDSRAKLDYAELACKPYSMHLKKNVLQKKAFWKKWWKYKFKTNIHVSLFILDCSWKKKNSCFFSLVFIVICGIRCERQKHIHCQSHDQVLNNRSWKQKKSFKNHLTKRLFWKKQHNHIKLPETVSALNSRFFENIVIPSKLDANRIIKFWMKSDLLEPVERL